MGYYSTSIELNKGIYYIKFKYHPELITEIKQLKGRWNPKDKIWWVSARGLDYRSFIGFIKKANLDYSKIGLLKKIEEGFNMDNIKKKLAERFNNVNTIKEYQWEGIQFIITHGGTMMADEMGLGKTLQSLASAIYLDAFPLLIVCPANLKLNWLHECKKWIKGLDDPEIFVAGLTKEFNENYNIYIINYEQLEKYLKNEVIEFNCCIIDESHYVKNNRAKRTRILRKIVEGIPHVVCMTGTPITNSPYDLYPQMLILNTFYRYFKNKEDYIERYCGGRNEWGGVMNLGLNLEELNDKISSFMIRRTKKEVLKELPKVRDIIIPVELTDYEEYIRLERGSVEDLIEKYPNSEKLIEKLEKEASNILTKFNKLRQCIGQMKYPAICEWLDNWLFSNPSSKIVVYTYFVDLAEQLQERYKGISVVYTGKLNMKEKGIAIDRFKKEDNIRMIICTIQAVKTGLNLTEASTTLFCELPWTPSDMDQAKARIHRIGQENICENYILLSHRTLEDYIWREIISKKDTIMKTAVDGLKVYIKDLWKKYSIKQIIRV